MPQGLFGLRACFLDVDLDAPAPGATAAPAFSRRRCPASVGATVQGRRHCDLGLPRPMPRRGREWTSTGQNPPGIVTSLSGDQVGARWDERMLVAQLDYIYFFFGLVLFLLGSVCVSMSRSASLPTPWWMLGLFAFVHGAAEWLQLFALTGGDTALFGLARTLVIGASFVSPARVRPPDDRGPPGIDAGHLDLPSRPRSRARSWTHRAGWPRFRGSPLRRRPRHLLDGVALLRGGFPDRGARRGRGFLACPRIRRGLLRGLRRGRRARRPVGPVPHRELAEPRGVPAVDRDSRPARPGTVGRRDGALHLGARGVLRPKGRALRKKRILFWAMSSSIVALLAGGWLFTDRLGRLHERDVMQEAESSASQTFDHLMMEAQGAERSARSLAELLGRYHVTEAGIDASRLDGVVDALALASAIRWSTCSIRRAGPSPRRTATSRTASSGRALAGDPTSRRHEAESRAGSSG